MAQFSLRICFVLWEGKSKQEVDVNTKVFLQNWRRLIVSRFQWAGIKVGDWPHCGWELKQEAVDAATLQHVHWLKRQPPCWFSLINRRLNPDLHFRAQCSATKWWCLLNDLFMSQISLLSVNILKVIRILYRLWFFLCCCATTDGYCKRIRMRIKKKHAG